MARPFPRPAPALVIGLVALAACAESERPDVVPDDAPSPGTAAVVSNESETEIAPGRSAPDAEVDTTLSPTVTVAGETVPRRALVTGVEAGDRACYLTLATDAGGVEEVMGDFSLCEGQAILNERVQIEYAPDVVPAASCGGDPACLDTETVAFAVAVDVIGRR